MPKVRDTLTRGAYRGSTLPEIVLDTPIQAGTCVFCSQLAALDNVLWEYIDDDDASEPYGKLIPICKACYASEDNWEPLEGEE